MTVDGIWGTNTAYAVKSFQSKYGLTVDGIVGEKTKAKFKSLGYYTGTKSASPGIHAIDELGTETIFQSANGAKYKLFTGGEKVLNAKASNFLYDFANKGSEILDKIVGSIFDNGIHGLSPVIANNNNIQMGDVIINGNAEKATVSEIRRAQRDAVETMLKEFNRLNK